MMNADTGRALQLKDHISQSVRNILFTRIGTRVQREEYGSLLPELIDMPLNPVTLMMCRVAVVSAVARWEPRINIKSVNIEARRPAGVVISFDAEIKETGAIDKFLIEAV